MFFGWRFLVAPKVAPVAAQSTSRAVFVSSGPTIQLLDEVERPLSVDAVGAVSSVPSSVVGARVQNRVVGGASAASILSVASHASSSVAARSLSNKFKPQLGEQCYWVGPFGDAADLAAFFARLRDLRILAVERLLPASAGWRYWVYLPPFSSRDAAKVQLEILQKMGIDSYLVTQGDHINGISLGLFAREVLAKAKVTEIRQKGWEPKMDSFERVVSQSWLVASREQVDAIGEGILPRMLKIKPACKYLKKNVMRVLRLIISFSRIPPPH